MIGTISAVLEWLRHQPSERLFTCSNIHGCVLAEYLRSVYPTAQTILVTNQYYSVVYRDDSEIDKPLDTESRAIVRAIDGMDPHCYHERITRDQAIVAIERIKL